MASVLVRRKTFALSGSLRTTERGLSFGNGTGTPVLEELAKHTYPLVTLPVSRSELLAYIYIYIYIYIYPHQIKCKRKQTLEVARHTLTTTTAVQAKKFNVCINSFLAKKHRSWFVFIFRVSQKEQVYRRVLWYEVAHVHCPLKCFWMTGPLNPYSSQCRHVFRRMVFLYYT